MLEVIVFVLAILVMEITLRLGKKKSEVSDITLALYKKGFYYNRVSKKIEKVPETICDFKDNILITE